jgi:Transposase DDE domain
MHAKRLWSLWQELALDVALGFTQQGQRRFVEWVTGLALNVEEHTITQSLIGLNRVPDWKALESFAEYGHWNLRLLQWGTAWASDRLPDRRWYGYRVWAGDDTKVHRSSPHVWGTCTFHEYTARCPNRASTVRAHNWVVLGALAPRPQEPALFLPVAGRLYFRQSQLPTTGEVFRTKCELLVELVRQQADALPGPHLAVFDGGFALRSVVRPLAQPSDPGLPRIDFLTRLRHDARLCALPPSERPPGRPGRQRKWGRPLPPPRQGGRWPGAWQEGHLFLYGRKRKVRWKEIVCLWRVLGHEVPVKAVVAEVEGYRKRFTLVTSARALTGLQVVELFAARFRQEDGFRDLKQRLGWEECRAWTKNPIERTTQALFVTLTLLRLLASRLEALAGEDWWLHPPWNPRKMRPSVLDVERLLRQHRPAIQQCLSDWLDQGEKPAAAPAPQGGRIKFPLPLRRP